jgi:Protein of unknown function (DUF3105)
MTGAFQTAWHERVSSACRRTVTCALRAAVLLLTTHCSADKGAALAGKDPGSDALASCTCSECAEETVLISSGVHTNQPVDYGQGAPAGGDHSPCWNTWGVHRKQLAAEHFVHNLEHGGVALLYNCPEGCDAERAWIEGFVEENALTLSTPYADMPHRFAVVSWGYRLQTDCLSSQAVLDFYRAHVDRGPESFDLPPPEPPDTCPSE